MRLFLLLFFFVYGIFNFYVFMKARKALRPGKGAALLVISFMLLMIAAPVLVRILERSGHELLATIGAYTGYMWLGLVFIFVSAAVLLDLYRFFLYAAGLALKRDFSGFAPSARAAFFIPVAIALFVSVYGYFEAIQIRTEHVLIRTSKLPAEVNKLRIVQLSDVHLGLIVGEKRLKRILKEVEKADPDILVSTGDLVDAQICGMKGLSDLISEIKPKYGKFAITGNHEFYAGLDQSLNCSDAAGFVMLRGEALNVGGVINIAGVDDPAGLRFGLSLASERAVLSPLSRGIFTVLLKHRPLVEKESLGFFDLQLSGHTHKGQIFPFSLATKLYYPLDAGLLRLADGSHLYVSRGAGTWGPPIRFLAPPEVTVIDLIREPR
jgi:uncharacterized protein